MRECVCGPCFEFIIGHYVEYIQDGGCAAVGVGVPWELPVVRAGPPA